MHAVKALTRKCLRGQSRSLAYCFVLFHFVPSNTANSRSCRAFVLDVPASRRPALWTRSLASLGQRPYARGFQEDRVQVGQVSLLPRARLMLRAAVEAQGVAEGGTKPKVLVGGVPADLDDKSLREAFERSDDDSQVTVCIEVEDSGKTRLDTYLSQKISILSRSSLNRMIKADCVTLNGKLPKPSAKLKPGDSLIVNLPPPITPSVLAEDIPVDILFEDDQVAVVNKQSNLVVHPAPTVPNGTLVNAMAFHFQYGSGQGELSGVGSENARPGIVHRLDKNTTGAMVIAKTEGAHWSLYEQFAARSTKKRYLALVHGTWKHSKLAGLIDEPLARHPYDPTRFAVCAKGEGKASQTKFFVRELFDGYTLVELHLLTGRTHQIRVHLSYIGHAIVGDELYGGRKLLVGDVVRSPQDLAALAGASSRLQRTTSNRKRPLLDRQALHSSVLTFSHPSTNQPLTVLAPAPDDMATAVALLRQWRLSEIVPPADGGADVDLGAIIRTPVALGAGFGDGGEEEGKDGETCGLMHVDDGRGRGHEGPEARGVRVSQSRDRVAQPRDQGGGDASSKASSDKPALSRRERKLQALLDDMDAV